MRGTVADRKGEFGPQAWRRREGSIVGPKVEISLVPSRIVRLKPDPLPERVYRRVASQTQTLKLSMENQLATGTPKRTLLSDSADPRTLPLEPIKVGRTRPGRPADLSEQNILRWADAFFERNGFWPNWHSGPIPKALGETWYTVAAAGSRAPRRVSPPAPRPADRGIPESTEGRAAEFFRHTDPPVG